MNLPDCFLLCSHSTCYLSRTSTRFPHFSQGCLLRCIGFCLASAFSRVLSSAHPAFPGLVCILAGRVRDIIHLSSGIRIFIVLMGGSRI